MHSLLDEKGPCRRLDGRHMLYHSVAPHLVRTQLRFPSGVGEMVKPKSGLPPTASVEITGRPDANSPASAGDLASASNKFCKHAVGITKRFI